MPKRAKFHRERRMVSPRTTLGITANDAWYHRERRRVSPRTPPGYHRERRLVSPRTPSGYHRKRRRLSLESMDLDTEQLSRFVTHNNL